MKRLPVLFCFLFCNHFSFGQKPIDNLIQAEKDFASYSVANSTKEAFLKFLDSNGIVFDNGKAVNGIELWNKRESRPGILNWYPLFAEIAASGDFGYTTGPWTFQPKTIQDSVVARGQYSTVWHKDEKGEWRFLIDLGSNNTPAAGIAEVLKIERTNQEYKSGNRKSLVKAEKKFIKLSGKSSRDAYKNNISFLFCLLNRNSTALGWFQDAYYKIFDSMPAKIQYSILGSGIALSGDLGYVYGITEINGKTDNYLRIWRREREGWKIAVEVLRY